MFGLEYSDVDNVVGSTNRRFGILFSMVFAIVGLVPVAYDDKVALWALIASCLIAIITSARPSLLAPFSSLWMKLGNALHKVVSPVVLGAIFYLVVWPTAIVVRLSGKEILKLKMEPDALTYWESRERSVQSPQTMKRQY
jgi:hypothetical protein